jgi:hypothetical protein
MTEGPDQARKKERGEAFVVGLCGRSMPAVKTADGIRAARHSQVIGLEGVRRYLEGNFGDDLAAAGSAMQPLAGSYPPQVSAERCFRRYEQFDPEVPEKVKGDPNGVPHLGLIDRLANEKA